MTTYDGPPRRGCSPASTTSIRLLDKGSWYSSSTSTPPRSACSRSAASALRLASHDRNSAADGDRFRRCDIWVASVEPMAPETASVLRPRPDVRRSDDKDLSPGSTDQRAGGGMSKERKPVGPRSHPRRDAAHGPAPILDR